MHELRDDFAALVAAGERTDLGRAALTIARIAYPELDVDVHLRALDALAVAARPHVTPGAPPEQAALELAAHLFGAGGFRGNKEDYYDPRNSFLCDVLERRTGIPITLAILLLETGARLGLPLEGVGFPGHFLVRVAPPGRPFLLDPFFGGRRVTDAELLERYRSVVGAPAETVPSAALAATPVPGILARMLRNLLRIYLERAEQAHALETVELVLVLLPDSPDELRVRGLLYEELECFAAAVTDLRRYLELAPEAPDAESVHGRIAALARRAATLH
jgi:regulator of sirC expression with transglutaminase-like and TPR domain